MKKKEFFWNLGTNEIEVMKFTVMGEFYGINVAKVQEIIMSEKVKPMPHAHPSVEGIFKPRDELITVINLAHYLSGEHHENGPRDLFIVTNFNKMTVAFRVERIEGISRISWKDIQKPDKTITNGSDSVATGIAQCGKELVTILDFEKIVAEIAPETTIQVSEIERMGDRPLCHHPVDRNRRFRAAEPDDQRFSGKSRIYGSQKFFQWSGGVELSFFHPK